jgi:SAM-dependent methyltransferase
VRNVQIDAYLAPRPLKQHEEEMLALIKERQLPGFAGRVLDIGCANGEFLLALGKVFPEATTVGIDASERLIAMARERAEGSRATFAVEDALTFRPDTPFDIVIASGILSVFDDIEHVLDLWLSWLAPGGRMYVFGRFHSRNIDTIVRFRNNHTNGDWEGGLTTYSVHTVDRLLSERGLPHEFRRFRLAMELAEQPDPIRTYTRRCADGEQLVVNGANLIAEHYYLVIERPGLAP